MKSQCIFGRFKSDTRGRIAFAIVAILILLISTIFSSYISSIHNNLVVKRTNEIYEEGTEHAYLSKMLHESVIESIYDAEKNTSLHGMHGMYMKNLNNIISDKINKKISMNYPMNTSDGKRVYLTLLTVRASPHSMLHKTSTLFENDGNIHSKAAIYACAEFSVIKFSRTSTTEKKISVDAIVPCEQLYIYDSLSKINYELTAEGFLNRISTVLMTRMLQLCEFETRSRNSKDVIYSMYMKALNISFELLLYKYFSKFSNSSFYDIINNGYAEVGKFYFEQIKSDLKRAGVNVKNLENEKVPSVRIYLGDNSKFQFFTFWRSDAWKINPDIFFKWRIVPGTYEISPRHLIGGEVAVNDLYNVIEISLWRYKIVLEMQYKNQTIEERYNLEIRTDIVYTQSKKENIKSHPQIEDGEYFWKEYAFRSYYLHRGYLEVHVGDGNGNTLRNISANTIVSIFIDGMEATTLRIDNSFDKIVIRNVPPGPHRIDAYLTYSNSSVVYGSTNINIEMNEKNEASIICCEDGITPLIWSMIFLRIKDIPKEKILPTFLNLLASIVSFPMSIDEKNATEDDIISFINNMEKFLKYSDAKKLKDSGAISVVYDSTKTMISMLKSIYKVFKFVKTIDEVYDVVEDAQLLYQSNYKSKTVVFIIKFRDKFVGSVRAFCNITFNEENGKLNMKSVEGKKIGDDRKKIVTPKMKKAMTIIDTIFLIYSWYSYYGKVVKVLKKGEKGEVTEEDIISLGVDGADLVIKTIDTVYKIVKSFKKDIVKTEVAQKTPKVWKSMSRSQKTFFAISNAVGIIVSVLEIYELYEKQKSISGDDFSKILYELFITPDKITMRAWSAILNIVSVIIDILLKIITNLIIRMLLTIISIILSVIMLMFVIIDLILNWDTYKSILNNEVPEECTRTLVRTVSGFLNSTRGFFANINQQLDSDIVNARCSASMVYIFKARYYFSTDAHTRRICNATYKWYYDASSAMLNKAFATKKLRFTLYAYWRQVDDFTDENTAKKDYCEFSEGFKSSSVPGGDIFLMGLAGYLITKPSDEEFFKRLQDWDGDIKVVYKNGSSTYLCQPRSDSSDLNRIRDFVYGLTPEVNENISQVKYVIAIKNGINMEGLMEWSETVSKIGEAIKWAKRDYDRYDMHLGVLHNFDSIENYTLHMGVIYATISTKYKKVSMTIKRKDNREFEYISSYGTVAIGKEIKEEIDVESIVGKEKGDEFPWRIMLESGNYIMYANTTSPKEEYKWEVNIPPYVLDRCIKKIKIRPKVTFELKYVINCYKPNTTFNSTLRLKGYSEDIDLPAFDNITISENKPLNLEVPIEWFYDNCDEYRDIILIMKFGINETTRIETEYVNVSLKYVAYTYGECTCRITVRPYKSPTLCRLENDSGILIPRIHDRYIIYSFC